MSDSRVRAKGEKRTRKLGGSGRPSARPARLTWTGMAKAVTLLAAASAAGLAFRQLGLAAANTLLIYILCVQLIALWTGGWLYAAASSFAGMALYNYLFTEPRFTLRVYDPDYPMTFVVMIAVSFITTALTVRIKNQAAQADERAYRTGVLLETNEKLQKAERAGEILRTAAAQMYKLSGCPAAVYEPDGQGSLRLTRIYPEWAGERAVPAQMADVQALRWVWENNHYAGRTTGRFGDAAAFYLAVRGQKQAQAVIGLLVSSRTNDDPVEKNLLLAMADQCGLALERERLSREKGEMAMEAQKEKLRANMLRSISHDLRTPLTSISGNAAVLLESGQMMSEDQRQALYKTIGEDSRWLIGLVENLLSITRMEDGAGQLHAEAELVEDVVREAVEHLDSRIKERELSWEVEDDMLMARMDARLIVQVLVNILNNAVRYTPPGSRIHIGVKGAGRMVLWEIADDGPGIADAEREKIFEMFYTGGSVGADGRRGMGLGLALCKSIVAAHGGQIGVRDAKPHGAVFWFTLQSAEVKYDG